MSENYARKVEERYAAWEKLHTDGGTDPGYPDGVNLNLIRNHIINYKRLMENTMWALLHAELFNRPLPPEVPNSYFAKPDEIRTKAKLSLERYKQDQNYLFLLSLDDSIPQKVRERAHVDAVLWYVQGLKLAIQKDDLVTMRRHRNPDHYLPSFESSASKIRETLQKDPVEPARKEIPSSAATPPLAARTQSLDAYIESNPLLSLL